MPGKNYLVVIGIDQYTSDAFPNLKNARKDAARFAEILCSRYNFELIQEPLFDGYASRRSIHKALANLSGLAKDDRLVIYFAGHGMHNFSLQMGYWVPCDGERDPADLIPNSTIIDHIKGIQAKHILLISDSCFSGSLIHQSRASGGLEPHDVLDARNSRWIFAAGGIEIVGDGSTDKGSPFALSLCEYLENNTIPSVSASDLFRDVIKMTKHRSLQEPIAGEVRCEANHGGEMIFRLNQSEDPLIENNPVPKKEFPLPETSQLEYYIPRTVTYYEHQKSEEKYFFEPERGKTYLADLIKTQNRISLLGSAGSGKSVELYNLAKNFQSQHSLFVPIYKRFNIYTEEEIEDFLPSGWNEVAPQTLVIFLDGLDEIQPHYFGTAIRKIISFAHKNPILRIVISCRTNFYELPDQTFSGTLEGFGVYMLNDISHFEINNYVANQFSIDGEDFLTKSYSAQFADLISKPYFLNILVKHFIAHGNFNDGRAGVMKEALKQYYNYNREHFKTNGPKLDEHQVFSLLERIAFVMEYLGKNFITDQELHKLFPLSADFDNCKFLPTFKRYTDADRWMFEHNNIQEYLASLVLDKEPLEKLIEIISIATQGIKRIKPTWTNTLSFMISVSTDETKINNLFEWIIVNDIEVLIRFEADRLNKEKRIFVFKEVFNYYSEKQVWISSNKFSNKDLARFGQFEEILNYLLNIIESSTSTRIVKLNAIHVIRDFDISNFHDYVNQIKITLFDFLELSDLESFDIYAVLGSFARLGITEKETIDKMVSKYSKSKNQYIRAGLYKLLHHSKFLDEHVNILLDGIDLSDIEEAIDDRESVNLMDESVHLKIGLEKVNAPEALKKIITRLSDPEKQGYFYSTDYQDILKSLIQRSIILYTRDKTIYDYLIKFLISSARHYNKNVSELMIPFFKETGTKWQAFLNIWNDKEMPEYIRGEAFSLLFDDEILAYFLNDYREGKLKGGDLIELHKLIRWHRGIQDEALDMLNQTEATGKADPDLVFERPEIRDWDKINKINTQKSFDLLFDKVELVNEIEGIFKEVGKDEIIRDDLFYMRSRRNEDFEEIFNPSAIDLLRDLTYGGLNISFEFVRNWINNDARFENYRIDAMYNYLHGSYGKYITVTDSQREFIQKWCDEIGNDIRILWFFMHHFKFQLEEGKVLNFISMYYDFNAEVNLEDPGTIDLLENFISKEKIIAKVSSNLEKGLGNDLSWVSNASYAIRQNLKATYPFILKHLETTTEEEYKLNEVLSLWFKRTSNSERLTRFIENSRSSILKWNAITLLNNSGKEKPFLIRYLNGIINKKSASLDDQLLGASSLMQLNEISGFNFTANHILEKADPRFDFGLYLRNMQGIRNVEAIPLLLKLLYLGKQKEFAEDRFNSLELKVLDSIYNIGVTSPENFAIVREALLEFIKTNTGTIENLNFLHLTISKMEDQLNMRLAQNYSIEQGISEYNSFTAQ